MNIQELRERQKQELEDLRAAKMGIQIVNRDLWREAKVSITFMVVILFFATTLALLV